MQKSCPEGVWGPRLQNKRETKSVGPSAPHICHTFIAQSRAPGPPLRTQFVCNFVFVVFTHAPIGLPRPLLRPRRPNQPTVVISVRSASCFANMGLVLERGAPFQDDCSSPVFRKSTLPSCLAFPWGFVGLSGPPLGGPGALPWGSHGRFYGHDEQRSPPS